MMRCARFPWRPRAVPQSELVFSQQQHYRRCAGAVYWEVTSDHFNKQITRVTSELHDDDAWVLGAPQQEDKKQIDDASRLRQLCDLLSHWDSYLTDIRLNNSTD